ncbi:MAG: hypothetical protein E6R03_04915 [Hyphomicrobiaceae bacterium]|nr:MAG: hypothetical protein E6R03_04915 [Hyphomicrobiaceae bacterium]
MLSLPLSSGSLAGLSDVLLTTLGDDEIIVSASGIFVNKTFAEAGISAVGHSHTAGDITDLTEAVQDIVGAFFADTSTINITYNDAAGSLVADILAANTLAALSAFVGDSGSGGVKGLVPAPATGDATKFLRGDGTWADGAGGGSGSTHWLDPVEVVTTSNVDLAGGGLANGTTHDGYVVSTGQRVLVAGQSSSTENGVYIVPASGAASRASDMAASKNASGDVVQIKRGSTYADWSGIVTSNSSVVGTDPITVGLRYNAVSTISANLVYAGPSTGSPAVASFRSLVAADLPAMVGDSGAGGTKGAVPAPAAGDAAAGKFLKADGTWAVPSGGGSSVPNHSAQGPIRNTMFRTWTHNGTSITDGAYTGPACWYFLQSGTNNTISAGTGLGKSSHSLIITNAAGANRRVGPSQIIEYYDVVPLRGQTVTFQMAWKRSSTGNVRAAVLEWTGTANAPTKDIVNNWSSTTYTGGNFFISTNYNVLAVSSPVSVGTSATNVSVTATIGSSANNIVCFMWTDDEYADGDTVEFSEAQLPTSSSGLTFQAQPLEREIINCGYLSRMFTSNGTNTDIIIGYGWAVSSTSAVIQIPLGHPIRTTPTLTFTASDWQLADSIGARQDVTGISITTAVCNTQFMLFMVVTVASGLTTGRPYSLLADTTSGRKFILDAEMGT